MSEERAKDPKEPTDPSEPGVKGVWSDDPRKKVPSAALPSSKLDLRSKSGAEPKRPPLPSRPLNLVATPRKRSAPSVAELAKRVAPKSARGSIVPTPGEVDESATKADDKKVLPEKSETKAREALFAKPDVPARAPDDPVMPRAKAVEAPSPLDAPNDDDTVVAAPAPSIEVPEEPKPAEVEPVPASVEAAPVEAAPVEAAPVEAAEERLAPSAAALAEAPDLRPKPPPPPKQPPKRARRTTLDPDEIGLESLDEESPAVAPPAPPPRPTPPRQAPESIPAPLFDLDPSLAPPGLHPLTAPPPPSRPVWLVGGFGFVLGALCTLLGAILLWPNGVANPQASVSAASSITPPAVEEPVEPAPEPVAVEEEPAIEEPAAEEEPAVEEEPVAEDAPAVEDEPAAASPRRAERRPRSRRPRRPRAERRPRVEATPPPRAARRDGPTPARPSREEVQRAITSITAQLHQCAPTHTGYTVNIRFTFVSNGRATSAVVPNDFAGPAQRSCIARVARSARVPPFSEPSLSVTYPVRF